MKIFTKKNTTQKIILAILIVTLCNFIFPTYSRAGIGGLLFEPITWFTVTICDVIISGLQNFFYDDTNIKVLGVISNIFLDDYKDIEEMKYTRK